MTRCYSIWTDVENNKEIKKGIKIIKESIVDHETLLRLYQKGYNVDTNQSFERLSSLSDSLNDYFPKENEVINQSVWLDYKESYIEDGSLVQNDISSAELEYKILSLMKKKITFVNQNLPKVKLLKGKDANNETFEEEVVVEAFTSMDINGQQVIVDAFYQFKYLLEKLGV